VSSDQRSAVVPDQLLLLEQLRSKEADLKTQYAQAAAKYGSAYPLLIQLKDQVNDIEGSIQRELQNMSERAANDYLAAKQTEDMIRQSFDQQKAEAIRLNDKAIQYGLLKGETDSSRKLYDDLLTKLEAGGVLAALRSTNVIVIDPARRSHLPAKPSYPKNLAAGLAVGLIVGLALAFGREATDDTVVTPERVEGILGVPCIGIVPDAKTCRELPRRRRTALDDVAKLAARTGQLREAYRGIRTWISASNRDANLQIIMIASALPEEGKTTTSLNAAIALAGNREKVLLVEADLRRPRLEGMLQLTPSAGLAGALMEPEGKTVELSQYPKVPNLHILVAGDCANASSELLASKRMSELVEEWRHEFDYIVIDTPPVLSFTDAVVASRIADAVLLVVRSGRTTLQSCSRVRDLLARARARLVGVVINRADLNCPDYTQYLGFSSAAYRNYYKQVSTGQQEKPTGRITA
jgi:succinoglycan biosynthesis transport protein ExoP